MHSHPISSRSAAALDTADLGQGYPT